MSGLKREQLLELLYECIKQKQFENKSPKTIKNLRNGMLRKDGEWQLMGLPLEFIDEIANQLKQKSKKNTFFDINQCRCERYMHQASKYLGMKVVTHTGRKINSTGKDSSQIMNAYGPFVDTDCGT